MSGCMIQKNNNNPGRQQESSARGIMYHSRMRYLASREGSRRSTSLKELGSGIVGESSIPRTSLTRSSSHIPCSPERLVPPVQLMTRERSFRYAYWKYHKFPAISFQNTDFLKKKEDPAVKKKRDEIFARIRAAELSSERLKRQKESWKRNESTHLNSNNSTMTKKRDEPMKSLSLEYSNRNITDDFGGIMEGSQLLSSATTTSTTTTTTSNDSKNDNSRYSSPNNNNLSNNEQNAFQLSGENGNNSKNKSNLQPFSSSLFKSPDSSSNEESNISEGDAYPENFSFISEWAKDQSYQWNK